MKKEAQAIRAAIGTFPTLKVKDIEALLIEVALERAGGNRCVAKELAGVSLSKIRAVINRTNLAAKKGLASIGRPKKK